MRRRLTLIVLAVTTMVVTAFVVPLASLVRVVVADRAVSAAEQEARSLAGVLASVADRESTRAVVGQLNAEGPRRASVIFADGAVVGSGIAVPPADLDEARGGRAFTLSTGDHRIVLVPVRTADGQVSVAAVSVEASELRRGVTGAWFVLAVLGVVLLLLGTVLANRLARATVRSIEDLGAVTVRLRGGDLDARARTDGVPELAEVGKAVNELAEQIETLLAVEREEAADLSHRLRTPLTALRLQVEQVADDEDRTRLAGSVDDLTAEVSAIIEATRQPRQLDATPQSADLGEVVDRRLVFWQVLADQQERTMAWQRPVGPLVISLSDEDLVTVLDAVLGNVFHHTPAGTAVRIVARTMDGVVTLAIEDDGPGPPRPALTSRGRSGAGSTGLGLDIVRRTAERSGGALRVGRAPSGGTRVEVRFGRTVPA